MRDELKQLQAKVEAQSFVIEELLGICVESGLTSAAIAGSWKSVRNSPTFFAADTEAKRLLADELDAWAEVLITRHPELWLDRCRSRRPSSRA